MRRSAGGAVARAGRGRESHRLSGAAREPGSDRGRGEPAVNSNGTRAALAQRTRAGARAVRSDRDRLPAGAQHPDRQCSGRSRLGRDPDAVRVYALEGLSSLVRTIEQIRATVNPRSKSRASCARCSIRETISARGQRAAHPAFWRARVPHADSAQYPPRRGAELWSLGPGARPGLARRAGVLALAGEMLRRDDEAHASASRPVSALDAPLAS